MLEYTNKMIKHRNNTDIAFKVNYVNDGGEYFNLIGVWYNIVSSMFPINEDIIHIKKEHMDNWKEYDHFKKQ